MSKKVAFFSDLDRTLVYSTASWDLFTEDDIPSLAVGEIWEKKPLSYLTFEAADILKDLSHYFTFVPTTTRTETQFNRIKIPNTTIDYAIVCNGAKILYKGVEDVAWTNIVRDVMLPHSEPVSRIYDVFKNVIDNASWIYRYTNVNDLFAYFVISKSETPESFYTDMADLAKSFNYKLSIQGRKVYLVPREIHKGVAVKELVDRLDLDYVISAGDSILDKSLLMVADYPIRPNHGELSETNYFLPRLIVTEKTGVRAGEEIVRMAYEKAKEVSLLTLSQRLNNMW
jgi:hydroxymethylpyrimidine pyrophosphatase-like HAD family hydrolase